MRQTLLRMCVAAIFIVMSAATPLIAVENLNRLRAALPVTDAPKAALLDAASITTALASEAECATATTEDPCDYTPVFYYQIWLCLIVLPWVCEEHFPGHTGIDSDPCDPHRWYYFCDWFGPVAVCSPCEQPAGYCPLELN